MSTPLEPRRPGLLLIACAAPPANDLPDVVPAAQAQGWDVCVVVTPSARSLFDVGRVESQTGRPVRSQYADTDWTDPLPPTSAVLLAPATFTMLNKLVAGIGDTLAAGLLAEAIGSRLPLVAAPWVQPRLAEHPLYDQTIQKLRDWGVTVIDGAGGHEEPASFPWRVALREVNNHFPDS